MQHFYHCLSALLVSPTPKLRLTELPAVPYFYLSLDHPLLPLHIQGLLFTCSVWASVSFKNFPSQISLSSSIGARIPLLSSDLSSSSLLSLYFIGEIKAIVCDCPQTQGLLFMKYLPPHPTTPYFQLQWKRCPSLNKVYPSVLLEQLLWGYNVRRNEFPCVRGNLCFCFYNFSLLDYCLGNYVPTSILIIESLHLGSPSKIHYCRICGQVVRKIYNET